MRPRLSHEQLTARLRSLTGSAVVEAGEVAGSVTNQNFAVRFADGRRALVKVGQAEPLRAEAWTLQRAAQLGIPVPAVFAVDHDSDPPLSVLGWIDGEPSDAGAVLEATGRHLRSLHEVTASGYGLLAVESGTARGGWADWAGFLAAELNGVGDLVEDGLLTDADADRIATVAGLELGHGQGPGVLLHGDLKRLHLLARGENLVGIIDWGDPVVGDPRWDLARLSMMGEPPLRAFLRGYELDLTDDLRRVLAGYRVIWNVSALTYEYRAGGDWFDAYRDGLRRDLDLLGA